MIITGPISPSDEVKTSIYQITYPYISGYMTIKYNYKTKRFIEFDADLSDLKLENLQDVIFRLERIRNELDPQFKIEDFKHKPKPWWKFW